VANPILKRGIWYAHVKDWKGVWRRQRLAPERTPAKPEGITEREARRRNGEIQAHQDLIRRGLAPAPLVNADDTLSDLIEWWLTSRVKADSQKRQGPTLRKHIVDWAPEAPLHQADCDYCRENRAEAVAVAIGRMAPGAVTSGKVDGFLHAKEKEGLAPGSLNHLRSWIRTAYNAAIRAERFHGKNPVTREGVTVRTVPEREHEYIREEWVPPILTEIAPQHRNLTAVAVYQGMRKGELFGLLKPDVDFELGVIHVRRSHGKDTVKGKKGKRIPIHPEAVPYLLDAIATSPLEHVFVHPDRKGSWTTYREDHKLAMNLRAAMRRAGVGITHYSHTCRRCGHQETSKDGVQRFCPTCATTRGRGLLLYPHIHVAELRFHDTRHTTGTLLAQKGVAVKAIQDFLRHADQRQTEKYLHSTSGWLRDEIAKLSFALPVPPPDEPISAVAAGLVPHLSPGGAEHRKPVLGTMRESEGFPMVGMVGATGFEPATPCPPGPSASCTQAGTGWQGADSQRFLPTGTDSPSHGPACDPPFGTRFVPPVSPDLSPRARALPSVRAVPDGLLTAADVARELGVCRATVYKLVETGALRSTRLLKNIIRVTRADLDAYVAAARRPR
jgi:excisionase family DNA binding protein